MLSSTHASGICRVYAETIEALQVLQLANFKAPLQLSHFGMARFWEPGMSRKCAQTLLSWMCMRAGSQNCGPLLCGEKAVEDQASEVKAPSSHRK